LNSKKGDYMSASAQELKVTDITAKWELAQRMAGHSKMPEDCLKALFEGIIQGIEKQANTTLKPSLRERVWEAVSKEKLKNLKETFILEVCEKILGGFKEAEVKEMLEEHKRAGAVKNSIYNAQLRVLHFSKKEPINDAVFKKVLSFKEDWIPQIVDMVKKEGIELP
jgi:hypothetical protein